MALHLAVIAGPGRVDVGKAWDLTGPLLLRVGRGADTDTKLNDPSVSREHCQIRVDGEKVVVSDCDSASDTRVNDEVISGDRTLAVGDVILIGNTKIKLRAGTVETGSTVPCDPPLPQ